MSFLPVVWSRRFALCVCFLGVSLTANAQVEIATDSENFFARGFATGLVCFGFGLSLRVIRKLVGSSSQSDV